MKRPAWLWAGLVWLAVVVAVSAVTWTVIDSAGRDVLGADRTSTGAAADGSTTVPTTVPTKAPTKVPTGGPSPSRTGKPSRTPTPSPSALASDPTSAPSTASTPATPPSSPAASSSTAGPKPSPTAAEPKVGTWQGAAGSVTVQCVGSRISLVSATPNDGWRVEVDERGPAEVEVEFKTGGEDEREVKVRARCVGGAPKFTVESDEGDGGEGEDDSELQTNLQSGVKDD